MKIRVEKLSNRGQAMQFPVAMHGPIWSPPNATQDVVTPNMTTRTHTAFLISNILR